MPWLKHHDPRRKTIYEVKRCYKTRSQPTFTRLFSCDNRKQCLLSLKKWIGFSHRSIQLCSTGSMRSKAFPKSLDQTGQSCCNFFVNPFVVSRVCFPGFVSVRFRVVSPLSPLSLSLLPSLSLSLSIYLSLSRSLSLLVSLSHIACGWQNTKRIKFHSAREHVSFLHTRTRWMAYTHATRPFHAHYLM